MPTQLEFDFEKDAGEQEDNNCFITGFSKEAGRIYGFLRVGSETVRFFCDIAINGKDGRVVGIGEPKIAPGFFHYESMMSAVTSFLSGLSASDISEIDCAVSLGRFEVVGVSSYGVDSKGFVKSEIVALVDGAKYVVTIRLPTFGSKRGWTYFDSEEIYEIHVEHHDLSCEIATTIFHESIRKIIREAEFLANE